MNKFIFFKNIILSTLCISNLNINFPINFNNKIHIVEKSSYDTNDFIDLFDKIEYTEKRNNHNEYNNNKLMSDTMTYAQVGFDSNNIECLRFATPIKNIDSSSYITYLRTVNVAEDKMIHVNTIYKSLNGANNKSYYYSGSSLVENDPKNDYYWANFIVKFSQDSKVKSEMISIVLNVDGWQAPFLTTSYDAIKLGNSPVATFVDENGKLIGRSIVKSGEVEPVFFGKLPTKEGTTFAGWSDGNTTYINLPTITSNTTFSPIFN